MDGGLYKLWMVDFIPKDVYRKCLISLISIIKTMIYFGLTLLPAIMSEARTQEWLEQNNLNYVLGENTQTYRRLVQ